MPKMGRLSSYSICLILCLINIGSCFSDQPVVRRAKRFSFESKTQETRNLPVSTRVCRELTSASLHTSLNEEEASCKFPANTTNTGDAILGELPHMALIGYKTNDTGMQYICGGTLISRDYVMTAAYCISSVGEKEFAVLLGELVLNNDTDGAEPELYEAAELIIHPKFNKTTHVNNIALIRLAKPVSIRPDLRPACLPSGRSFGAGALVASGWGSDINDTGLHDKLRKIKMSEVPHAECNAMYNDTLKYGVDEASMLCAVHPLGKYDTCSGDGGGPLSIVSTEVPCAHEVVGITLLGQPCFSNDTPRKPTVFARVSNYVDWIEKVIWVTNADE